MYHNPPPRSLVSHKPGMATVMMSSAARTPSPLSASSTPQPPPPPPVFQSTTTSPSTSAPSNANSIPPYHAPGPVHSPKPSLGFARSYPAYHPAAVDVSVIVSQAADTAATTSASGFRRAHSRPTSVSMARSVSASAFSSFDAEKGGSSSNCAPLSPRASHDVRRSHDFRELNMRASHDLRRSHDFGLRASHDFGATRPSHDFARDFARPSNDYSAFPPSWSHSVHGEPPRRMPVRQLVLRAAKDRLSCGSRSGALGRGLIIGWVLTTLGFITATAFWKGELFTALDHLSKDLYNMGYQGLFVFGFLIFITTIPPLPLYSTLIVLSGYTFGVWNGFVASYIASLVGAVVVFVVSRTMLRDAVTRSLASSPTATSLLQIIPQNPHLLLLIRIAPYPYNLLNVVLASAPSLSLQTYTACTALSLCKLVLHTWIGAGIRDLSAAYNGGEVEHGEDDAHHERVKAGVTWGGIVLCCVLFVYLTHIAKKAIKRAQDEQLGTGMGVPEEQVAFLSSVGDGRDDSE